MSDGIEVKSSHIFLSSSADIEAICRPLQKHLKVSSFVYQRNFNDGSEIRLTNQPIWTQYFYKHGYYNISGFEKHPDHYQSGIIVWSHLSHHTPILNEARKFNIDHGLTLIQKLPDGCEFYFLGTTPDKGYVTNILLNNLEFLQQFIFYFKEQAASLLNKANQSRLIIPKKYASVVTHEQGIPEKNSKLNSKNIFNLKRIYIDNNLTLSQREVTVAKLLLQGKSARAIAEQLFLSPRTIEIYVQNLKIKLACHKKSDLIIKLLELKINFL